MNPAHPLRKDAIQIVKRLQNAGHTAYFAGGCVRDRLLGLEPKDYDVATSASPAEVLKLFPNGDPVGAHFGIILVRLSGSHYEIATFRKDGSYSDGRRPDSVTFTGAEDDAKRRDFTINGLFEDPVAERIIDHVGGQADLASRILRAIGNPTQRFAEDYLRLLRAVRFSALLDFAIEDNTWTAICEESPRIRLIAPERIREELDKIWKHRNRLKGFDLLVASGLMTAILPEIMNLKGCQQPPEFHPEGDVFTHTRLMLSLLKPDASLTLVLAVLFHDIAKPATRTYDEESQRIRFNGHDKAGAEMTFEILKRLRYSNQVIEAVTSAVLHHMEFINVQQMRVSTLKRFMAREHFDDELELHRADCESSHRNLDNFHYLQNRRLEFSSAAILPPPFLKGQDLLQRGHRPGPEIGLILREAHDLQLEGKLDSRSAALSWLEEKLSGKN